MEIVTQQLLNIVRSCGVNTAAGCSPVPGLSPWSVVRDGGRCLLTAGPLQDSDSGGWECHLTQHGVSESTAVLTRQDLVTSPLTISPPGPGLTVVEGDEVSWRCETSATVTTQPRASWSVGGRRYPGNTSTTHHTQSNGVKVGATLTITSQRNVLIPARFTPSPRL